MPAEYTLVGNFESLTGSTTGSVQIELAGYGAQSPRVAGVGVISQKFYASAVGTSFSVTLWGNDQITPASTYYKISTFRGDGTPVFQNEPFLLTGSGTNDLSTLTPLSAAPPPIPVPSTVSANLALMGPVSGGTAPPVYRTIQNPDLAAITALTGLQAIDTVTIFADQMPGADNSAKIQAAINAIYALSNTGGIVDARALPSETSGGSVNIDPGATKAITILLGAGTTYINKLTVQPNLRILGIGSGSSVLQAASTTQSPFVSSTTATMTHVEFRDFQLNAQSGSTYSQNGMDFTINATTTSLLNQGLWYSFFENLTIQGFGGNNLFLDGSGGGDGATNAGLGAHQFNTFINVNVYRKNVGNWVSGTSYTPGQTVTINGGVCTGTYNSGTAYVIGNVVIDSSKILYLCIQNGTGHTPSSSPTFWTPMSQYQSAATYRCVTATSSANPLTANWAAYDSEALYLYGSCGQNTFISCEIGSQFGGNNSGVNVRLSAVNSVGVNFCLPYSTKFIKCSNQFAAIGYYVTGALTLHIDSGHFEALYGAILLDYDPVANQTITGFTCNNAHILTNCGINGTAGYLGWLTANTTSTTGNFGNEYGDFTFTNNNVFGFSGSTTPDNVVFAVNGSTQVVSQNNTSAASSSAIGPSTYVQSFPAAAFLNIGRARLVNLTTTGTNITSIAVNMSPGECVTFNCSSGPVVFATGGNLTLGTASTLTLQTHNTATFMTLDGSSGLALVANS